MATNFGGVHVAGCHCWVPLLESRHAGVPLLGPIAQCHFWVPLLGCHCEKAIAGRHCEKKLARVIHHSPLHLSLYIDNTQIGLCYLGSMLAKVSGRQPRSYTASVRRRTSTTRECRERPWKPSRHRRKKKRGNYKVASSHRHIASKNITKKKHKKKKTKMTGKKTTHAKTPNASGE